MISAATLIALLGGSASADDASEVTRLETWEKSAHAELERLTGRTFRAVAALVEHYNGNETQRLELRCPVASGTPVIEVNYGGSTWTVVPADQWELRTHETLGINNVVVLYSQKWGYGYGIRATYSGGYAANGEPDDVRDFVAARAIQRFRSRGVALSATTTTETGDGAGLSDDLKAIVERWRAPMGLVAQPLVRVA